MKKVKEDFTRAKALLPTSMSSLSGHGKGIVEGPLLGSSVVEYWRMLEQTFMCQFRIILWYMLCWELMVR